MFRDIEAGSEVTFNYNFLPFGEEKLVCKCGASNCSGLLGVPPKNSQSWSSSSTSDLQSIDGLRGLPRRKRRKAPASNCEPACKSQKKKKEADWKYLGDDGLCFKCGEAGCDLGCSLDHCPRVYHAACLDLKRPLPPPQPPVTVWVCPWHLCDQCGQLATVYCYLCVVSFCEGHADTGGMEMVADGLLACPRHRPVAG